MNITAVELDQWLNQRTPEHHAAAHHRLGDGFSDQLLAARQESIAAVEATGITDRPTEITQPPEWLRLSMLDTFIGWVRGTGRTCLHAPHPLRPEPVSACAWKPGIVVCAQCHPLLAAHGDRDRTCDRCGHLCDGIDAGDPIYPFVVWFGALAFHTGLCQPCRDDTNQTPAHD